MAAGILAYRYDQLGEVITVNKWVRLLYPKYAGKPMGENLACHPRRFISYTLALAKLHAEMHTKPMNADIPSLRHRLGHKIWDAKQLPENIRVTALKVLEIIPDGDWLCHGDFHLGNDMLSQPEPVIINWIDASIGNPMANVARTSILAQGMVEAGSQFSRFQCTGLRLMHAIYLRCYF